MVGQSERWQVAVVEKCCMKPIFYQAIYIALLLPCKNGIRFLVVEVSVTYS